MFIRQLSYQRALFSRTDRRGCVRFSDGAETACAAAARGASGYAVRDAARRDRNSGRTRRTQRSGTDPHEPGDGREAVVPGDGPGYVCNVAEALPGDLLVSRLR